MFAQIFPAPFLASFVTEILISPCILVNFNLIGMIVPPKCDVNPQPNTWGIVPLVGRTSGNRRCVMHVLAVILSITYHFSFICQYIFIRVLWSGRKLEWGCPNGTKYPPRQPIQTI